MDSKSFKKSFVSRSVYQKMAEENKRLMRDLRAITVGDPVEAFKVRRYWRDYFRKKDQRKSEIKEILTMAKEYHLNSINNVIEN